MSTEITEANFALPLIVEMLGRAQELCRYAASKCMLKRGASYVATVCGKLANLEMHSHLHYRPVHYFGTTLCHIMICIAAGRILKEAILESL
jgi:hypothetical protein